MQRMDSARLEFFKREFRYLQGVSHANLVQLYDLESDGQEWLLTMEFVAGVNFLTHVRPSGGQEIEKPLPSTTAEEAGAPLTAFMPSVQPSLHESRLRKALGELAEGVCALHAHRRIHRDLKPGNVLVTPEGRVVLLDFGLATDLDSGGKHLHTGEMVLGTIAYMAPEQSLKPPVSSPASDWYSVGVMLYEALTGKRPFKGDYLKMIKDKCTTDPMPPYDQCPGVPRDLNDLCLALLRRSPNDRPSGNEILERLGRKSGASTVRDMVTEDASFLGRDTQLQLLEDAYQASGQRRAVLVAVHGPSGVGKSALVQHFLNRLHQRAAVVLAGRCYEHESVPYKALDPIVDELGAYLRGLPHNEVEARLPRDVGPLTRVFPVLVRVGAVAEAAARSSPSPDPQELRRQAFAGLRELLARIGDRRPLVLHIDDFQWGDVDSAYLLAELLRPPDPPSLLLLLSYRSEDTASPCLRALADALGKEQTFLRKELAVAPLTEAETGELVFRMLGPDAGAHVGSIARESGGNPFFITQLVQEILSAGEHAESRQGQITLEGLIRNRVSRLPEGAQRLLEVVAVSGRPIGEDEAFQAADANADMRVVLARLESAKFVRGTQSTEGRHLETYHDRIRETVMAGLAPDSLQKHHRRLALVLEASVDADAEVVAGHFECAAERAKAGEFYARAAERAAEALAFDHAANLFQRSLDLRPLSGTEGRKLQIARANALANAGRGAEAGPIFSATAEGLEGFEQCELRLRAADQFMLSGHTKEGLEILNMLLRGVGLGMAGGRRRALFNMLLERIRMRLRGTHYQERTAATIPPEELLRVDLCQTAFHRMMTVDATQGLRFQAKQVRLALRAGEPSRVAEGLANEAFLTTVDSGMKPSIRSQQAWNRAMSLADRLNNPFTSAYTTSLAGWCAWAQGHWKTALSMLERAEMIAVKGHVFAALGITKLLHGKLDCLMMLGRWKDISRSIPVWLQDARRRGDQFGISTMLVHSYVACLAANRPDDAISAIGQCWDVWPQEGNIMGTYWSLYGRAETALFRGEGTGAWDLIHRDRATLKQTTLYQFLPIFKLVMVQLQARAALAAAAAMPAGGRYFDKRSRLVRAAEREARRIEWHRPSWCDPLATLVRAGIANLKGRSEESVALLSAAEAGCTGADLSLYAAVAKRRRGQLLGGVEGKALVDAADAYMSEQEIRNPARITAMLAPGFND
jgi:tRNA A-37 threonylcarbamoyl transferase component Bud32